jgi:hypothetical protein
MNQSGAASIELAAIPPAKKIIPTMSLINVRREAASR